LIFQLDANATGTFKGNMRIPSNDDNNAMWEFNGGGYENPYTFPFMGIVNPDISGAVALNLTTPTNGLVTSDTGGLNCGTGSTVCTATYTQGVLSLLPQHLIQGQHSPVGEVIAVVLQILSRSL
jgi:hypothetical protein